MTSRFLQWLIPVLVWGATARGTVLFEESFDSLAGWPKGSLTNGLEYPGITSSGSALTEAGTWANAPSFNGSGYGDSTLYFSALADGMVNNQNRLVFFSAESGSSKVGVGFDGNGTQIAALIGTGSATLTGNSVSYSSASTVLIVGKFELSSSGNETVTLWINPTDFSGEAALAASAVGTSTASAAGDLNLTAISYIYPRQQDASTVYDEIRLGTTLADVVAFSGTPPVSFAEWATAHGVGGFDGDDDGDGLSNLHEYALNGNPTNGTDVGLFEYDLAQVVYARRKSCTPQLYYVLEACTDLAATNGWSSSLPEPATGPLNDLFEAVTNPLPNLDPTFFVRLSISTNNPIPDPDPPTNQVAIAESLRLLVDDFDVAYDHQDNVTMLWLWNVKDSLKPGVDDQTFIDALSAFPKLVDIHIERQPLSDTGLSILQNFPNLHSAEFHYMDDVGTPSADYSRFVAGARNLTTFEIKHHFGSISGTVSLSSVVAAGGFPQLERLVLDHNAATWQEGAALLAAAAPNLRELETHRSNLRNADYADIAAACPNLEILWLRPLSASGMADVGVMPTLGTLTALQELKFLGAYDQMTMPYTDGLDYLTNLPDLLRVYMPATWKDGGIKQAAVDTFISAYQSAQGHKVTVYFGYSAYN